MGTKHETIGWIGLGRTAFPMAERLRKAGSAISMGTAPRAKAEPLAAKGGKVVDKLTDLAAMDVVFSIVSTCRDLEEVYFGRNGVASGGRMPKILVTCSTLAGDDSAAILARFDQLARALVAPPA